MKRQPSRGFLAPIACAGLVLVLCGRLEAKEETEDVTFPVVTEGEPVAKVLVARDDVHYTPAVHDLQKYVEKCSGAKLEVIEGAADLPGPTLHVGETEYFPALRENLGAIRVDGFLIARIGEDLVIAGALAQGTGNGIWTVLQDHFGIRWYHPGELWEVVPATRNLAIRFTPNQGSAVRIESPSFLGRHYWGSPPTQTYGRRMRLTQPGTPLPYVGTGHALDRVVPLEKYAKSHADYFALVDGRRITDRVSHPCFTHPDMFDVFMEYVRAGGTSFGMNDNLDACRCERCLAVDDSSGLYMGMWNCSESYFRLMARVARQTAKEFPHRRLGVFAYQLTNAPPRTVDSIGKNIDVVLCQDTSQHFDSDVRNTDYSMSAEWVKKVGGVSLYDYYGINYWTPRYLPSLLAGQLKHLARSGVLGYITHGTTMPDSAMPMFYLYGRLLWNVGLDPQEIIEEMLDDLYGEAKEPIRKFYAHWEDCWLRQEKGRWFRGMDDFRAEMTIYSLGDIERGWELLKEADRLARREKVKRRIDSLKSSFAFTRAAAKAHAASMRAIQSPAPSDPSEACKLSDDVVVAWRNFARQLAVSEKIPGTSASGWHPKTFRVRAWALKQQMRDAVLAPLVKWVCASEGNVEPRRLRAAERELARVALASRAAVEDLITESVGGARRPPRADPLHAADIPRIRESLSLEAGPTDWPDNHRIEGLPWVFRRRPPNFEIGKYDEPMAQHIVDPPPPGDHSAAWQGGWDERSLYLRIVVTDDIHTPSPQPSSPGDGDGVQVTFNPLRWRFDDYDEHSWYFLMGDYRKEKPSFMVALQGGAARLHIVTPPPLSGGLDAKGLIQATAARHASRTAYAMAVDWRWLPGFCPRREKSFGISIVVNDCDGEGDIPRTAEYGDGVFPRRRPTEFAALRLVESLDEE